MKGKRAWPGMKNLTGKIREYKTEKGVLKAFHSDKAFLVCSVSGKTSARSPTVYPSNLEGVRVKLHYTGGNVQTVYDRQAKLPKLKHARKKRIKAPPEIKAKPHPIGYIPSLGCNATTSNNYQGLAEILFFWNVDGEFIFLDGDREGEKVNQSELFGQMVKLVYDNKKSYIIVTAHKSCLIDLTKVGLYSDPDIKF